VEIVMSHLRRHPSTEYVESVERDSFFQSKEIDVLWHRRRGLAVRIEVKTSSYPNAEHYFFETTSNAGKGTAGWVDYSLADYVYYVFLQVDDAGFRPTEMHYFPMAAARTWFREHADDFPEKLSTTLVAGGAYAGKGRLVPAKALQEHVRGSGRRIFADRARVTQQGT